MENLAWGARRLGAPASPHACAVAMPRALRGRALEASSARALAEKQLDVDAAKELLLELDFLMHWLAI